MGKSIGMGEHVKQAMAWFRSKKEQGDKRNDGLLLNAAVKAIGGVFTDSETEYLRLWVKASKPAADTAVENAGVNPADVTPIGVSTESKANPDKAANQPQEGKKMKKDKTTDASATLQNVATAGAAIATVAHDLAVMLTPANKPKMERTFTLPAGADPTDEITSRIGTQAAFLQKLAKSHGGSDAWVGGAYVCRPTGDPVGTKGKKHQVYTFEWQTAPSLSDAKAATRWLNTACSKWGFSGHLGAGFVIPAAGNVAPTVVMFNI